MSGSLSIGKKHFATKYLGKKYLSWRLMLEKILHSYTAGKKNSHPNQITHTSLKSQIVDP